MKSDTPYLVLARKYRPATFDEVVGQEAVATTLKNAIASGRVAHAYLFAGPRGVGKTSMARILAKALNCLKTDRPTTEPCGECEACRAIARGTDLDAVEFDAASNRKVEEIQGLILDHVDYAPARCRFKIFIIDEVQQLSDHAFDSLLKTLEEPPPHVRFIFATTHPGDVPPTIHSRCQRFDFRRLSPERILEHLKGICASEKAGVDEETLRLVSRAAQGAVRDALSILDQVIALGGSDPAQAAALIGIPPDETFGRLLDAALRRDLSAGFAVLGEAWERGWDLREFSEGFLQCLRDHLVAAGGDLEALQWRYAPEMRKAVEARARSVPVDRWLFLMDRAVAGIPHVREGLAGRVALEILFLGLLGEARPVPERVAPLADAPPTPPPPPPSAPGRPVAAGIPSAGADWEAVIDKVGEKRMSLAAMLRGTRLAGIEGDVALIQLPSDRTGMDLERLNEAPRRAILEEALASVAGRPLKPRFEIAGGGPKGAAPSASPAVAPRPAGTANDPLVQLAAKLLAGRVVKRSPD